MSCGRHIYQKCVRGQGSPRIPLGNSRRSPRLPSRLDRKAPPPKSQPLRRLGAPILAPSALSFCVPSQCKILATPLPRTRFMSWRGRSTLVSVVRGLWYRMSYGGQFGGVVTIRPEMFRKINGFPIVYFGWGGEDDDMGSRFCAVWIEMVVLCV